MKNFFIALLVFLVWSVFGLWMYSLAASPMKQNQLASEKISEIKEDIPQVNEDVVAITPEIENTEITAIEKDFVISSLDNNIIFESDHTIAIEKDNPFVFLDEDLSSLPDILTAYLQEHPGQELHILSYYSPSAKIQTPNIGQQRGNYFKQMLLDLGAEDEQIVVKPVISTSDFDEYNSLKNGMTFTFKLLNRERIANHKAAIPEEITFYPSYNFDDLLANNKLTELTNQIVGIHQENPNLKITVVGHTDHIGADSENYIRGLKSARQIKWYFVNKGRIKRSAITAISKGETEPILRDGKPASLKENKRIQIQFTEE